MSAASIVKLISCSKQKLIDMVLDIEKYPEFVPCAFLVRFMKN